jgi:hypothetical protein
MRAGSAVFLLMAAPLVCAEALAASCQGQSPSYTPAVVELYTSQGCSSCPPADRWLSRLPVGDPAVHVIPLAFHIGYWDYIGWKDPFARKEFNNRQYQLAEHNGGGNVYTPEVFVGAAELAQWDRQESFGKALAEANRRTPMARIDLQAQWAAAAPAASGADAARTLSVSARWSADASAKAPQLLLAVKQSGYVTDVKAGENRGASLRNDHVVRAWAGPYEPDKGALKTELSVPAGATAGATLVAIAQDAATGTILQAMELPLASCEPAR